MTVNTFHTEYLAKERLREAYSQARRARVSHALRAANRARRAAQKAERALQRAEATYR